MVNYECVYCRDFSANGDELTDHLHNAHDLETPLMDPVE